MLSPPFWLRGAPGKGVPLIDVGGAGKQGIAHLLDPPIIDPAPVDAGVDDGEVGVPLVPEGDPVMLVVVPARYRVICGAVPFLLNGLKPFG
mgnify:CR=1 FL=1